MQKSTITYNFTENVWIIRDETDPSLIAISNTSFSSLALGNYEWKIYNDVHCSLKPYTVTLSLTSCQEDQFTCNGGLCIDIAHRCDGDVDCKDSSDEVDCHVVEIGSEYKKYLTPVQEKISEKISVNLSLTIHSLSSFDPEGHYSAKFTVLMKWFDQRLSFNNLKDHPEINHLQPQEVEDIWIPKFIFDNTVDKDFSKIDSKATLKILKKTNGSLRSNIDLENKYVYSGDANPLVYERFYYNEFECQFDLQWHPFDSQTCYLDIKQELQSVRLGEY